MRSLPALATGLVVFLLTRNVVFALAAGGVHFFSELTFHRACHRTRPKPVVIWLTGLPAAGKTTLALELMSKLKAKGLNVEQLDGDSIRDLFPKTGFSRAERTEHVKRVGFLASRLERNGVSVIASLISPYRESRDFVRGLCSNFLEVYVSTPLQECENRDPKGLYKKAREGKVENFTGVSDPYEEPLSPEVTIDTRTLSVQESVDRILKKLTEHQGRDRGV